MDRKRRAHADESCCGAGLYNGRPPAGREHEIDHGVLSRIPDFPTNVLYGRHDFDHKNFPGYSNHPFFIRAAESNCAYVNVFDTWARVLQRKDQPSLLGNNINHPDDFGHWLYLQSFVALSF